MAPSCGNRGGTDETVRWIICPFPQSVDNGEEESMLLKPLKEAASKIIGIVWFLSLDLFLL